MNSTITPYKNTSYIRAHYIHTTIYNGIYRDPTFPRWASTEWQQLDSLCSHLPWKKDRKRGRMEQPTTTTTKKLQLTINPCCSCCSLLGCPSTTYTKFSPTTHIYLPHHRLPVCTHQVQDNGPCPESRTPDWSYWSVCNEGSCSKPLHTPSDPPSLQVVLPLHHYPGSEDMCL